jgi:hypothetical protein
MPANPLLMSYILQRPTLFDQPILLSEEEKQNPLAVIEGLFADHRLYEIKDFLEDVMEVCLTTDNVPFFEPEKRSDLLAFKNAIEKCLEAAFLQMRNKDLSAKRPSRENSTEKTLRPLIGEINLSEVQKRIAEIQDKVAQLYHIVAAAYGASIEKLLKH